MKTKCLLPAISLSLLLAACGGGSPAPSPTALPSPTRLAATPTAQITIQPTEPPDCPPPDLLAAEQAYASLASYRARLNAEVADTGFLALHITNTHDASEIAMFGKDMLDWKAAPELQIRMILIGDQLYAYTPDEGWQVIKGLFVRSMIAAQTSVVKDELIDRLPEPTCTDGDELRAGIRTYHYHYAGIQVADLLSDRLPEGIEIKNAAMDVWLATEEAYFVAYQATITASVSGLATPIVAEYELLDVNTSVDIQAPPGVVERPFPQDIPVVEDAVVLFSAEKTLIYATDATPDAVQAFYEMQLDKQGWQPDSQPVARSEPDVEAFGYVKGKRRIVIEIGVRDGITTVSLRHEQ